MRVVFVIMSALVGLLSAVLPTKCLASGEKQVFRDSTVLMGTVVELTVAHQSEAQARAVIGDCFSELRKIEAQLDGKQAESTISRLNREGFRHLVPVRREIFELIRQATAISEASGGAFDVTISPVVELWGFLKGGNIPNRDDLTAKLKKVGYRNLIFDTNSNSVGFSVEGMAVELGAIAEGWAADRVVDLLKARGVRDAIIDIGGDLRLLGARPGREYWRIGVKHPREAGALLATFELRDTAIATSGDYERFFEEGGVRYHHILDPGTGQPARGCQSVTVLASTAAEADACSTAAFVLGPERGLAFLRARPGVRGLIVDAGGGLHWTDVALERAARR